jgi:hypothetical protein
MKEQSSTALVKTFSANTSLSAYGQKALPIPSDDHAPGKTFILFSRASPFAFLVFITWLGMHLSPGRGDLAAAFIALMAPPGAALFLLPFLPLPGFVRRALWRRRPRALPALLPSTHDRRST